MDEGRRRGATSDELTELAQLRKDKRRLEQENEILRRATAYFAVTWPQNDVPAGPRARRRPVPVAVTCGVLGLCRQAYYRWLASPVCQRDWDDAHTINRMRAIHDDDPEFGYRFIADKLELAGHRTGENRVQRLCAQERIYSAPPRAAGTPAGAGSP